MKRFLWCSLVAISQQLFAQETQWATEFQSSFIDISGLFGLDEPAQVTTMRYQNKGIFLEGFHSFSWKEPGKTIQTFFTAGYQLDFDTLRSKTFSVGNGFAFNRVADNGSFLRPVMTFNWRVKGPHTLSFVSWMFLDTRNETAQPLNGGTAYVAHTFKRSFIKVQWRNELRLLYSHVKNIRNVGGITDQLKLTLLNCNIYFVGNTGYSFYRSDHKTEFIYNFGVGKSF